MQISYRIINIFEFIEDSLSAVQYENMATDELTYVLDCWNDVDFLRDFFKENLSDLCNNFHNFTINEAVKITIREAKNLNEYMLSLAKLGNTDIKNTLQMLFKALDDNEYREDALELQKTKAVGIDRKNLGKNRKSWLRIYAIRLGANCFIISGGAIKLTRDMKKEHLQIELQKLEVTKMYLDACDVLDENDYQYLKLIRKWQ